MNRLIGVGVQKGRAESEAKLLLLLLFFVCVCVCVCVCERVKLKVRFSEHWFYLLIRSKPLKMYLRHACVQSRFICHLYLPFAVNGDHLLTV